MAGVAIKIAIVVLQGRSSDQGLSPPCRLPIRARTWKRSVHFRLRAQIPPVLSRYWTCYRYPVSFSQRSSGINRLHVVDIISVLDMNSY
jgi:hypothetical protein